MEHEWRTFWSKNPKKRFEMTEKTHFSTLLCIQILRTDTTLFRPPNQRPRHTQMIWRWIHYASTNYRSTYPFSGWTINLNKIEPTLQSEHIPKPNWNQTSIQRIQAYVKIMCGSRLLRKDFFCRRSARVGWPQLCCGAGIRHGCKVQVEIHLHTTADGITRHRQHLCTERVACRMP